MIVDTPKYPLEVWYIHALLLNGVCLFYVSPEFFLTQSLAGIEGWHLHRITIHLN